MKMIKKELCPKCGHVMILATSSSGSATGQKIEEHWICPKCKTTK